jgi:hypothetical protein
MLLYYWLPTGIYDENLANLKIFYSKFGEFWPFFHEKSSK